MIVQPFKRVQDKWSHAGEDKLAQAQLVIYFGGQGVLDSGSVYEELRAFYPQAHIMGCSTGGEIYGEHVLDESVVAAAVYLEKTPVRVALEEVQGAEQSFAVGEKIARKLQADDLKSIFILSDGVNVNGSDLITGLYSVLSPDVIVTGGLAGDGADFKRTVVALDESVKEMQVVAVGFYGDAFKVGYGSAGGWDTFGPKRTITRSEANVLYELDGRPALDLYKLYLGDDACRLPGSGLLFPLSVYPELDPGRKLVRTIVGIDEEAKSMIFAGDVPQGYTAQLMNGNFSRITDAAAQAAESARAQGVPSGNSLSVLVSCIGRKLMLGQYISDETEAAQEVFGPDMPLIGFYSYGEVCPQEFTGQCSLHNQTMTISVFYEA